MAKGRRDESEGSGDLDLAPIMNMVVILIPLLLLSIVFLKVGVINITAPKLSMGPPSEEKPPDDEVKLNLTVAVNAAGFTIGAQNAILPPENGCPTPGPTICLSAQDKDVNAMLEGARAKLTSGDAQGGEAELREAMKAYDWIALYNKLTDIKGRFKEETIINISADPNIPYALIIRMMDVTRYKLEKDTYKDASQFWSAKYKRAGKTPELLFPDPVLSLPKG